MKFIHIADVHLGAQPEAAVYSQSRGRELWESFEKILGVCEDERTDLLLIAGDLFHRQPLVRELKEVNYLFSELTATKVVLIAGNHPAGPLPTITGLWDSCFSPASGK